MMIDFIALCLFTSVLIGLGVGIAHLMRGSLAPKKEDHCLCGKHQIDKGAYYDDGRVRHEEFVCQPRREVIYR